MPDTHSRKLIIHWREPNPHQTLWIIRGLQDDGKYYGEVRARSLKVNHCEPQQGGMAFEGTLLPDEVDTVFARAQQIRGTGGRDTTEDRTGLLAEGQYSSPAILHTYAEVNATSPADTSFLAIIAVFRPHFQHHFDTLCQRLSDPNSM